MKKLAFFAIWGAFAAAHAQTETITFDSINLGNGQYAALGSYAGLIWGNGYALNPNSSIYDPSGYTFGEVSAPNVGFDGGGAPLVITDTSGFFTLNNGYITAAWNDGLDVDFEGYNDGVDVISGNFEIDTEAPTYFYSTYTAEINELVISSSGGTNAGYSGAGTQFVLDNVNVTLSPSSSTPGPEAVIPFGLGLIGVIRRRRRS